MKSSRIIFRELKIYFWGSNFGSNFSSKSKSLILYKEVSFKRLLKNYLYYIYWELKGGDASFSDLLVINWVYIWRVVLPVVINENFVLLSNALQLNFIDFLQILPGSFNLLRLYYRQLLTLLQSTLLLK